MTLLKPTLQLRKLRVMRDATAIYEADFHDGVNIIRGHNASGKSTIVDFIFYALGGDSIPWKTEALLCTDVLAEVEVNEVALTLRRPISEKTKNPMAFYWGPLADAQRASHSMWQSYPYQRSASKESFSQILFRSLELPELRGEGSANITMHQLLRLLYVDQRTPHDKIFRSEPFDTTLVRETVGNYLCGVYSADLYDAQLELRIVDAQLDRSVSDLRNIFNILGRSGQSTNTADFLRAEAASIAEDIADTRKQIAVLRNSAAHSASSVDGTAAVRRLRDDLSTLQREYARNRAEVAELQLEIEDSRQFIAEVDRRLSSLDDSGAARSYFGAIRFNFCPCCLGRIEETKEPAICPLCKNPVEQRAADSQLLRMKNELAQQRRESAKLLEARALRLETLTRDAPALEHRLGQLEQEFQAMATQWVSPREREIEVATVHLGELNQKLVQIAEYQKLASVLEGLQDDRARLAARKAELQDIIEALQGKDEETKDRARLAIADELVALLRKDLRRQEAFFNATEVDWDFGQDRVSVNGQTQFSESSMVILKHCFRLALLAASATQPFFRVPRFVLLDGIEDGGQEIERSHSLQRHIVELSGRLPARHQIIYATSQIAPELADSEYVVGKASTVEDKTLSLRQPGTA
jgi:hypothetical protein